MRQALNRLRMEFREVVEAYNADIRARKVRAIWLMPLSSRLQAQLL